MIVRFVLHPQQIIVSEHSLEEEGICQLLTFVVLYLSFQITRYLTYTYSM